MKFCVIIPCHNHSEALFKVLKKIRKGISVIVVDDGSLPPLDIGGTEAVLLRNPQNMGKASALKSGFKYAVEHGFTHVVTMDADGQHPPEFADDFMRAACKNENSIILGVRDFKNSGAPWGRVFLNKFSNFCMWAETGVRVGDTQCGYRCYPLKEIAQLNVPQSGFVFEVELLVKAAWANVGFSEIKIPAIYDAGTLASSHYRPFADTVKFTIMNIKLFFTRLLTTSKTRERIALKK